MDARELVNATVFSLEEVEVGRPNRDIAIEMAEALAGEYPERYALGVSHGELVAIKDARACYPKDPGVCRYRTIDYNIVRLANGAAIELCVSNQFVGLKNESESGDLAAWKKRISDVPWKEHVERVRQLVLDLEEAGWILPVMDLESYQARQVRMVNRAGSVFYDGRGFSKIVKEPLVIPDGIDLVVADSAGEMSQGMIEGLIDALNRLFNDKQGKAVTVSRKNDLERLSADQVGLIVLPSEWVPSPRDPLYAFLQQLESTKAKFQLSLAKSLHNRFSLQNIAFSLFELAGGLGWTTETHRARTIISLDAGHARVASLSRWCATRYESKSSKVDVAFYDSERKENLTEAVFERIAAKWSGKGYEVWRDGRWHKDDVSWIQPKFPASQCYEVIKNPRSVLYRGSIESPAVPHLGDCVRYENGHYLVQTIEVDGAKGYQRPLRVRGDIDGEQLDDIVSLCKRPAKSIYHSSRLPIPLYWADRASKLTVDGWLKAIGQGWGLAGPL